MASTLRFDNWENSNGDLIGTAADGYLGVPGTVLQVVSTTKTDVFSTSLAAGASTAITGLSASITPSSTSSKILVSFSFDFSGDRATAGAILKRDGTGILLGDSGGDDRVTRGVTAADGTNNTGSMISFVGLDSPASTSSLTYSLDLINLRTTTSALFVGRGAYLVFRDSRSVSTITLMEIAG